MKPNKQFLLAAIWFGMAFFMSACAAPPKIITVTLRDIMIAPTPAIIIKDNYTFAGETAPYAETMQFLITTKPCPLPLVEKALQFDPRMFSPRAIQPKGNMKETSPENIQPLSVFFQKDSSVLDDQEIKKLNQFIKTVKEDSTGSVNVTGYTCQLGTATYNQKLALNRAKTVGGILKQSGIQVRSIAGKSKCCFISDTDPAKNRRVEITVLPPVNQQPLKNDNRKEVNKNE
jgi:outer membrane protein OmpA-like peptidoglycan-associated protein